MSRNLNLTPQQTVSELDKHIIGQDEAKKTLAIALRNRWRRLHAPVSIREEIMPDNILMEGPTGTGKTELGRRLAKICKLPFLKVEATQYTERGYVGDDVKNMIHLLADKATDIIRKEKRASIQKTVEEQVNNLILDIILPPLEQSSDENKGREGQPDKEVHLNKETREIYYKKIAAGELDERSIEIDIRESSAGINLIGSTMMDENMLAAIGNMMNRLMPPKVKRRKVTIGQAKKILMEEQMERRLDAHNLREEARQRAEKGIIFIDEIDKITSTPESRSHGPDVSREGVQRNLLPIVEGTTVNTKIGPVRTDHIMFIAAGAFHQSTPSDLMPEFQGRFPTHVQLKELSESDYADILKNPKNALTKQQQALLKAEDITLEFTPDSIKAMAKAAFIFNSQKENTGARRLRTILAQVLRDILFDVPEKIKPGSKISVTKSLASRQLQGLMEKEMNKDYIL